MTLIELIFFIINAGFLAAAMLAGAILHGATGTFLALIAGAVLLVAVYRVLVWLGGWLHGSHPAQPACGNGACGVGDYEWLTPRDGCLVCRCRCGLCYVIKGQRFLELLADGTTRPFMAGHSWAAGRSTLGNANERKRDRSKY